MCLLTFAWSPDSATPLKLAGNRDEFHARPTAPLHYWEDTPGLLGGRDLEAGGTWLAANDRGVVAALTNVREPGAPLPAPAPSRGELIARALREDDIEAWLERLVKKEATRFAGFNLLVAQNHSLWHLHRSASRVYLERVAPGVHGLSNASLDTPWPKLCAARKALKEANDDWQGATKRALHDPTLAPDSALPDTGIALELERRLSAAFIVGQEYGTRATSWLSLEASGRVQITEQRFGPMGRFEGETTLAQPRALA
ncbi:NRDE family protein [Halomonas sp. PAMB 3232]|uniref:NRDE family protein n=1 Tax=Halomonas sp. PAMB 3232 TaxID=3075221 RepID=UPI00289ECCE6|nr:NRDE family protein [Halomonas sp. PAMB 3232]WNL40183.1 NRDE family protein [Halomonas sp. PAMB 3232]